MGVYHVISTQVGRGARMGGADQIWGRQADLSWR